MQTSDIDSVIDFALAHLPGGTGDYVSEYLPPDARPLQVEHEDLERTQELTAVES